MNASVPPETFRLVMRNLAMALPSLRRGRDDFLRAGQFGKWRMWFGLIPIGDAVIIVAAFERRFAVALLDEEAQGFIEHHRVGDVPAVSSRVRFFEDRDAKKGEASRAQAVGFAEIVLGAGALHF